MPDATQLHIWGEQLDGTFVTPFYYTQADLQQHARLTGVSEADEAEAVRRATTTVSRVSRRLKLPGKTYAIASTLLHRFYAVWPRKSPRYTEEEMICACIDLACKLQETPIRLPQISHHVLSEMRGEKLTEEEARTEMEYKLSPHQQKLLESLQFNVDIVHPFRALTCFVTLLEGVTFTSSESSGNDNYPKKYLYGFCSGMVLDTYRITLCIQYPPHVIAMASLYLAKKLLDHISISTVIDASFMARCECDWKNVEDVALQILEMYATNRTNAEHPLILKAKPIMDKLLDRRRRRSLTAQ
ncbi:Cyclin- protein fam58a [Geranomyces variabilis]|uniref:Cyclin- protein fam58a n=1 Tax=Geranomyces variabilis TaxID=109894 RepID=A0AAD5TLI8_9FUNG|nr:Cyclin- protein fam58a [Geranomyces variabilis]